MSNKIISWVALVASTIALVVCVALVGGNNQSGISLGAGGTRFAHGLSVASTSLPSNNGLILGGSGVEVSQLIVGSTTVVYSDSQVSASTTKAFDLAVSGVVSGDNVSVQLSTTTVPGFGAWILTGASASSTSGFITIQIANLTGATRNLPREIASSTFYKVTR